MSDRLTLMAVHAHPDDETIFGGMTLARYASEGVRTILVTCTGGEEGEIVVPELDTPENHERLAETRRGELEEACRALGVAKSYMLGYRDSGMAGTPANGHPASFHQARFDEAVERLVHLVRLERPHVMLTYPEDGSYGHPDHIRAHQIAAAAFGLAGDVAYGADLGQPWQPLKLYYHLFTRGRMRAMREAMRARGITPPWDDDGDASPERGQPDERVTTRIDVRGFFPHRRNALLAHRTQIKRDGWNIDPPADLIELMYGEELFVCANASVEVQPGETDFFAGIRPAGGK